MQGRQHLLLAQTEPLMAMLLLERFTGLELADAIGDKAPIALDRRLLASSEGQKQPVAGQPVPAQPIRTGRLARRCAAAALRPVVGTDDHACSHWFHRDVARKLLEIRFLLNDDRLVATVKNMSAPPMNLVEALGIDAVGLPDTLGEIRVRRLHAQVIVVGHEAVGVP